MLASCAYFHDLYLALRKIEIEQRSKSCARVLGFEDFLPTVLKRFASKLNEIVNRMYAFSLFVGKEKKKVVVMLLVLVVFASALFLFGPILGQLIFTRTIGSHGTVKAFGVGVYWDSGCGNAVSSIDWGLVEPGLASNVTFYIRNEGNYPVTLFLGAENWNPENASNYLTLSWDYAGETVGCDETVQVTLTLLASQDMEGITDFSFDVILSGTA